VILFRIPSPIASYEIVSDTVDVQTYEHRGSVYPAGRVETYSAAIGNALAGFAAELGIEYVDLRPDLQAATRELAIHGPVDWKHLNEDGYTVLGEVVAHRIASTARSGGGRLDPEATP
jgi:lysophospholipase L1-like esterase